MPRLLFVACILVSLALIPTLAIRVSNSPLPEYRPFDGYGTNPEHPTWGAVKQMPAAYTDGIQQMPGGNRLSAREVSNLIFATSAKRTSPHLDNALHTFFASLVANDITHTVGGDEPAPIPVPPCDPFKDPQVNGVCGVENKTLDFARSEFLRVNMSDSSSPMVEPRTQLNQNTAWLDLSFVYSPDPVVLDLQRNPADRCKLLTNKFVNGTAVVPNQGPWVLGGNTQSINLTPVQHSYFHLFANFHNLICDQYKAKNPEWVDFIRFQESRAWTIAVFQAITVREYLASTAGSPLGPYVNAKGMKALNLGVDPGIDNFFSTVAFRYGHTRVRSNLPRTDDNLQEIPQGSLLMRNCLLNPTTYYVPDSRHGLLTQNGVLMGPGAPNIFRGAAHSRSGRVEPAVVDDLRNFLFGPPGGNPSGGDLVSLNIQRGRDHGMPSYNEARAYFGLPKFSSWAEVTDDIDLRQRLNAVYPNISDADAYVGALAEPHVTSGIVGQLVRMSILEQFGRLRAGDRFWYQNDIFTDEEINEIHGLGLIDVIRLVYEEEFPNANSLPAHPFFVDTRQINSSDINLLVFPDIPDQFKPNLQQLAPAYRLSWHVSGDEIEILLQCKASGWVGFGIGADPNSMKNADIILCRMLPDDPNNFECRDTFSLDVGLPMLDTDIGGTNDFLDVTHNRTVETGVSTYTVRRKLVTGDSRDKDYTNEETPIIIAFHPDAMQLRYHGPTASSQFSFVFVVDSLATPVGLLAFCGALAGLGIVFSLINMGAVLAKKEHYQYQVRLFCQMILFGTILGYASVLVMLAPPTTATCVINMWFINLSYVFVFCGLFFKTYRMFRIVGNKKLIVVKITDLDVLKNILIFLALEVVVLAVWTGVDRPIAEVVQDRSFGQILKSSHLVCRHQVDIFWFISLGYKMAFLLFGVFLTFKTRNFPPVFNDSRPIGATIYLTTLTLFLLVPIAIVLRDFPDAIFALRGIGSTLPYILATFILFGPALFRVLGGQPAMKWEPTTGQNTLGLRSIHGIPQSSNTPTDNLTPTEQVA